MRLKVTDQQGLVTLTCPTCRQVTPIPATGVAGLQTAFQANKLLDILQEHKKAKENTLFCPEHQHRELELYCEPCEKLICLQCTIRDHNGHEYNLVKDVFEKHKAEIMASLNPAEEQLMETGQNLEQLDDDYRKIFDRHTALESLIFKSTQELHQAIENRRLQLLSKLQRLTQTRLQSIVAERIRMEAIQAHLKTYLDMAHEMVKEGNRGEVLNRKGAFVKEVGDLTTAFQSDSSLPYVDTIAEFETTPRALEECQKHGCLVTSPDPPKCYLSGIREMVAGEQCNAVLHVLDGIGEPCEVPLLQLQCELVSEITCDKVQVSVTKKNQYYEIAYQPTVKGKHKLHVRLAGRHINGSPHGLKVTSPVKMLGNPIFGIHETSRLWGVALGREGEIVVSEFDKNCISVFSPSGEKLRLFGTRGTGKGQFAHPRGVAVDNEGIVDSDNCRIQKFTAAGEFLAEAGNDGALQLKYPRSIAFNSRNQKLYVVDKHHYIQVLNSDLTFSFAFGKGAGRDKVQLRSPRGVACDGDGKVYVADSVNNRIQVFTAEGKFLKIFSRYGFGRAGMNFPLGIAVDNNGVVYIVENQHHLVSVFTSEGQLLTLFGSKGEGPGEFTLPTTVAVDDCGVVYVCDCSNSRLQAF